MPKKSPTLRTASVDLFSFFLTLSCPLAKQGICRGLQEDTAPLCRRLTGRCEPSHHRSLPKAGDGSGGSSEDAHAHRQLQPQTASPTPTHSGLRGSHEVCLCNVLSTRDTAAESGSAQPGVKSALLVFWSALCSRRADGTETPQANSTDTLSTEMKGLGFTRPVLQHLPHLCCDHLRAQCALLQDPQDS